MTDQVSHCVTKRLKELCTTQLRGSEIGQTIDPHQLIELIMVPLKPKSLSHHSTLNPRETVYQATLGTACSPIKEIMLPASK